MLERFNNMADSNLREEKKMNIDYFDGGTFAISSEMLMKQKENESSSSRVTDEEK